MHELALCEAIAASVARRASGRPVTRVDVRIGHLRQVVPDALQFCWPMVTESTELEGAELVLEEVPAVIVCTRCATPTTLSMPVLLCPSCGSDAVELVSGDELMLVSLELAEAR